MWLVKPGTISRRLNPEHQLLALPVLQHAPPLPHTSEEKTGIQAVATGLNPPPRDSVQQASSQNKWTKKRISVHR